MRIQKPNRNTRQVIHLVGEGLTELYYFSHLKRLNGYRYSISPRLFENNGIDKIEKKIKELLNEDVFVICVFDADVSKRNASENKKLEALRKRYMNNKNVLLCDSLQSIEYWFLLHYEDTCRHFQNAYTTEQALKHYMPAFSKNRKFLEKEKWVSDMSADGRLEKACSLAEKYEERESYSKIYKAIQYLSKSDK
ncbi:RloB family protein [Parabacteroides segnis]|uniref:RloB family protein n=1 Tax=Parabacteroides segnis TaxID=2763058 RepID=UPI0035139A61